MLLTLTLRHTLQCPESAKGKRMAYTVNKLAKLSGVSVRTLHFYDEIGLLKPAYYGDNNYRYYEEEQLLMLQQILFFRELDLSLDEIKRIMSSNDFDKLEALHSHKHILQQDLDRRKILIDTIDKTIAHLRGNATMKNEELYYGFESEQQKQYEKDLVDRGIVSQEFMNDCQKKMKHWTQKDEAAFMQEGKAINDALIAAIHKKCEPASQEVQAIMRRHHTWVGWNPTQEKYIGLSQLYLTPEFRVFYEKLHPDLLEFIVAAMKVFADRELS
jgi:DNA-binding transcriptional MerR regulator